MELEIKKYVDSITRYAAAIAVAVCSLALTQSVHAQASPSIEKKSLKILGAVCHDILNVSVRVLGH